MHRVQYAPESVISYRPTIPIIRHDFQYSSPIPFELRIENEVIEHRLPQEVNEEQNMGIIINMNELADICLICRDKFDTEIPCLQTKCNHVFHEPCIKQSVGSGNTTCPKCRASLS